MLCLWADQSELMALFMVLNLRIGPGFIFESVVNFSIAIFHVPGRVIIHCLLALLYQWRRFGSLKGFQIHLSANTNIFPCPSICLNFINTGQVGIYLTLKNCRMAMDHSGVLGPTLHHRPSCRPGNRL